VAPCNLLALDHSSLPCFAAGNVFTKGTQPSKFEADALLKPDFDPGVKLSQRADGWYLDITLDPSWNAEPVRKLVTTELLGKAKVPGCAFANADGSPLGIDTDYFGRKRNEQNPFPGPFEVVRGGHQILTVWPVEPPQDGAPPALPVQIHPMQ